MGAILPPHGSSAGLFAPGTACNQKGLLHFSALGAQHSHLLTNKSFTFLQRAYLREGDLTVFTATALLGSDDGDSSSLA